MFQYIPVIFTLDIYEIKLIFRRSTKRQPSDQMDAWWTEATRDQECHGKFIQIFFTLTSVLQHHTGQVAMLNCLIKRNHNLAVVFLDETTTDDEVLLAELENIDGETKKYDIDFVKVCSLIKTKNNENNKEQHW